MLLLLFIILVVLFSIPAVQTYLGQKIASSISEAKDVDISIGEIGLTYFGDVAMDNVLIKDHHNDTLIHAREVQTSILSFSNLYRNNPRLGTTNVDGLELDMKIYEGEEQDNLGIFIDKFESQTKTESTQFVLTAAKIIVEDGHFSFVNENLENEEVLVLKDIALQAEDLIIEGPEVAVDILELAASEKRGVEIQDLNTRFFYSRESMELRDLSLETVESTVEAELFFDRTNGFGNFDDNVPLIVKIESASISSNDLQPFYAAFGEDQKINFSATLEGVLNDFELHELLLDGMDRTFLDANLAVKNLFSVEEEMFSIDGNVEEFSTNYYDLVNLLPGLLQEKLPEILQEFGNVQLVGDVNMTEYAIDAVVDIYSQLGNADVTMAIEGYNNPEIAQYEGKVVAKDFNIGNLLDNPVLGMATFDVLVDGSGLTAESLDAQVRGSISKFRFNGYTYNNIKLRGNLQAPVFNGNFITADPNLRMEFNGLADFSKETNIYDFEAAVAHADLATLNFISRDSLSVFQGDIIMNMRGTNLNNAVGEILLLNTSYENTNDIYVFDDLRITSSFEGPERTIEVVSPDVINGTVEGVFDITEVEALFENAIGSLYTNYRPNNLTTNQYLDFNFDIYNKIVEVFLPQVTLAPETYIRGSVASDDSEFRLTFRSPEILAYDNLLKDVNIQVDNTNPLFNTFIEVDSVATDFYDLSEFNLINVTMKDTLFVRSEFRGGPRNNDIFNLNLYHTINENNNSVVGIQNSDIKFKESVWHLNEFSNKSNRVIFQDGFRDIRVDSLVLSHENEEVRLSGQMRDSTYKNFKMEFDNVHLNKITPDIEKLKLEGIVNGSLDLLQRKGAYFPSTSLTVQDLEINNQFLGDLYVDVMGNRDLSFYNVNTTLTNEGLESLSAIGEIAVNEGTPVINLDVDLRNFNLRAFSPLGGEAVNNIRGLVSGNSDVSGNYRNPDFTGELVLKDAGLAIPYLEVDYDFEDAALVDLSQQRFIFNDITVTDTEYGTTGTLDGFIGHENFKSWELGLNVETDRLLVLNTEENEDALYYGTGFMRGNASIFGPTNELIINVTGTTERGTVFKIPIGETEIIGDHSFIHFLSPEEKMARLAGEEIEIEEIKGMELNFDLDVTNDALVEIDFDGSILRGRGAGTLLIEISTLGKFNMWGDFIANSGEYIFNYGALQKRFEVRPGGSINWSGSPLQADLNIYAVYEALANPAIILENPSVSRRIPVDVVVNLEGELIQPEFSFDLEYPNVTSAVRSELEYKIETNANTEMQAFSLLTLGQFYTPNVLTGNTGPSLVGNVFESASGFFNDLLSDESGKFQVGLNYEQGARTPEQNTADRFGVTLSTQISDRVLINGQVGVPVGGVTETVVVGNLEIEFLLNEEGNLRAKIFNRENNIQYLGEELGFTQGVGLTYQVDFNTFQELIRKITSGNQAATRVLRIEETDPEEEEQQQKSLAPDYIKFPGVEAL